MKDNTSDLLKRISEQDAQIKKLIAASIALERRLLKMDSRVGRIKHELRNHTNLLGSIKRTLHKGN